MATALKKYDAAFSQAEALRMENADLKQKVEAKENKSIDDRLKYAKLQQDYDVAVALIHRIPKEILEEYRSNSKQRKFQQDSR